MGERLTVSSFLRRALAGGGLTDVGLATLSSLGGDHGEPADEDDGQDGDGAGALPPILGDGLVGGAVYGAEEGLVASASASAVGADQRRAVGVENVKITADKGRELPDNLGDPVLGGGQELLGLLASVCGVGADADDAGYTVDKSTGEGLSQLASDLIHITAVDAGVELLGVVCYNGSGKKSDGNVTDVGLMVGIGVGTGIRIKIGAQGGACRVELAIAEDKPALVNGRGTVVAVVAEDVAEEAADKARLVRQAKHG